jgi:hypothetical protein
MLYTMMQGILVLTDCWCVCPLACLLNRVSDCASFPIVPAAAAAAATTEEKVDIITKVLRTRNMAEKAH